jgi:hypothetical protein
VLSEGAVCSAESRVLAVERGARRGSGVIGESGGVGLVTTATTAVLAWRTWARMGYGPVADAECHDV